MARANKHSCDFNRYDSSESSKFFADYKSNPRAYTERVLTNEELYKNIKSLIPYFIELGRDFDPEELSRVCDEGPPRYWIYSNTSTGIETEFIDAYIHECDAKEEVSEMDVQCNIESKPKDYRDFQTWIIARCDE
jgi:hypothetical protein